MFQRIGIPRTFALALRGLRHALYRVVGVVGGRPLLSMQEAMSDRELVGQHYAGTQPIALDRIVGSLDRSTDFDRGFGTRTTAQKSRVRDLGRAFRRRELPPIKVYEIDGQYFVSDGHHRVALAHERGMLDVDAEVIRIRVRKRCATPRLACAAA